MINNLKKNQTLLCETKGKIGPSPKKQQQKYKSYEKARTEQGERNMFQSSPRRFVIFRSFSPSLTNNRIVRYILITAISLQRYASLCNCHRLVLFIGSWFSHQLHLFLFLHQCCSYVVQQYLDIVKPFRSNCFNCVFQGTLPSDRHTLQNITGQN